MKYYCWRCQSSEHEMPPSIHMKYHEMLDDMRAFGTATCSLKDLGYNIDTNVQVKPSNIIDFTPKSGMV